MKRMQRAFGIFLLPILLSGVSLQAAPQVQAELLANTAKIEAGRPFWVGVRLTIDPQWHVYWQNPGTAGLAPRVRLQLPDGFIATPLLFPTPHRFEQPGNVVAFGYEHSVMLLAEVTPPDELAKDFKTTLTANVSWLVCDTEQCVMGKQTVSLPLEAETAERQNAALFERWRSQLPVDVSASPDVGSVQVSGDLNTDSNISLTIHWKSSPPTGVECFPDVIDNYDVTGGIAQRNGQDDVMTLAIRPLQGTSPAAETLNLVVGYDASLGRRQGIKLKLSLPKAAVVADNP